MDNCWIDAMLHHVRVLVTCWSPDPLHLRKKWQSQFPSLKN
jgi:hypothetical protein